MAALPSTKTPPGMIAPDFSLTDVVTGAVRTLQELRGDTATLIMFICNHCPYVIHVRDVLIRLAGEYMSKGISVVGISSNDPVSYPDDAPDRLREFAIAFDIPFPYLFDEEQDVARAYQAACTPDFYLFDRDLRCVYHGQLDDSRPRNQIPVTGRDLRGALDAVIDGRAIDPEQQPSIGCSIKWRA